MYCACLSSSRAACAGTFKADAPDRDQKLRRVAEALQSRIDEYSEKINSLSDRIVRLTEEKRTLTDVNRELREQITELKGERAEAQGVVATLGVVLDRLPATVS
jgi:chromosome segregation ATPase